MQKIAEEVGVNSALLYQHFTSVADLFEKAMLEPLEQRVLETVAEAKKRAPARRTIGSRYSRCT